jgi:hypothetical protein
MHELNEQPAQIPARKRAPYTGATPKPEETLIKNTSICLSGQGSIPLLKNHVSVPAESVKQQVHRDHTVLLHTSQAIT